MAAIVARLPAVAPVHQASVPMGTPAPQAPVVAQDHQVPVASTPAHVNQIKKPLVLNGMVIEVDPVTSMVNATQMCHAAGKFYAHYSTTAEMTEFVQTLSSTIGIPIFDLVRTKPGHSGGTMVHRRVAMYLAQRISPLFNVQVTGYLDELLLTGRVELGKEKTPEQLDAIWERRIAEQQADDNNAFLREKRCLELSLLRIKCAADEEEKNDRAVKRQRDDAAAEEDIVAKRAKRQRDDAVADDKAKEESRMQLVRFDAEMAANAILTAEDLKLKRLEVQDRQSNCAKNLIDLQANFMPKLTSCLQPSLYVNARLRSAMNDIEENLAHKINKCLTGDDCKASGEASGEASGYQETLYCNDFQTFLREMGRPMATTEQLKKLGMYVSKKYKEANNNTKPEKTMKTVNGANCRVNTYKIEHKDFIEKCIREYYGQSTASITETAPEVPVAKPPKDMRSFFGVANVNVTISCKK
jgi:hypothetical protein